MNRFRQVLGSCIAVLLALSLLAGCGDDGGDDAGSTQSTLEEGSADDQPSTTATADEGDDSDSDDSDSDDGGSAGRTEVVSIRAEVTHGDEPAQVFEVTVDEVDEAANPAMVWMICSAATAPDPASFQGLYFVTGLDRIQETDLRTIGVEASEDVDGPGIYPARFQFSAPGSPLVEAEGELTLNDDMRSGSFTGTDGSGTAVTASYSCGV